MIINTSRTRGTVTHFQWLHLVDSCVNHCLHSFHCHWRAYIGVYEQCSVWSWVQIIHFAHHNADFTGFRPLFFGSMLLEWAKDYFLPIPQAGLAAVEIPISLLLTTVVYASWGSGPTGFGLSCRPVASLCCLISPEIPLLRHQAVSRAEKLGQIHGCNNYLQSAKGCPEVTLQRTPHAHLDGSQSHNGPVWPLGPGTLESLHLLMTLWGIKDGSAKI